jgi:hypothetical protein
MSNLRPSVSGGAEGTRRATEAAPETGRSGKARWSVKRKAQLVLKLLRGADLESLSRKYAVTAVTLSAWRDAFLAGGEATLKVRQEDLLDGQGRPTTDSSPSSPWETSPCGSHPPLLGQLSF